MNAKELKSILQALQDHDVNEVSLETSDYKLTVKRGADIQYVSAPQIAAPVVVAAAPAQPAAAPVAAPQIAAPVAEPANNFSEIKSPIVGTFYAASSPDAAAFVSEGSVVKKGQVLCIVEAMKLMNEIEAEIDGTIRKVISKNGDPVEFGQVLFLIEPA